VIAAEAQGYLHAQGRVLVEMGWRQAADVRAIFEAQGWGDLTILPDLDGRDRILCAAKPG
jgi:release factor glutamine methyltransferase